MKTLVLSIGIAAILCGCGGGEKPVENADKGAQSQAAKAAPIDDSLKQALRHAKMSKKD